MPAEIIKSLGLRRCTYGFDWFRSGSFFIEEFLRLPLPSFLERYVMNPCIPLRQENGYDNNGAILDTVEVRPVSSSYGYNYLYNPHRLLNRVETSGYFERSFTRLKQVWQDNSVMKRFIMADYVNKEHASFLHDSTEIADWFKGLQDRYLFMGELYIVRITLEQSKIYRMDAVAHAGGGQCQVFICNVRYWKGLDCEDQRNLVYGKIARSLFRDVDGMELWSPLS